MKLTGKCKKDFEKWFNKKHNVDLFCTYNREYYQDFYNIPQSMQYGVLVDFFDSVGINILICYDYGIGIGCVKGYFYTINGRSYSKTKRIRLEAREQAIEKSIEIYNEQL